MAEPNSLLNQLSHALADHAIHASARLVAVRIGDGRALSAILWRDDVVVTSEQALADVDDFTLTLPDGTQAAARLAGRDRGTNVAVLRSERAVTMAVPAAAPAPAVASLAVAVGVGPVARMAIVAEVGPAWHSMAGGRIDSFLRLDMRVGPGEEGGPVIDAEGVLLGMATAGPRGRALVIPTATIDRTVDPLLAQGRVRRGWLGLGLQPVAVPEALRPEAGQQAGLMIASLAAGGPAESAGCVPGDILLALDGLSVMRPRALRTMLGAETVGTPIALRLIRAGAVHILNATVAARPE